MIIHKDSISFRKAQIRDAQMLSEIAWLSKKHWGYPDEWMEMWRNELQISKELILERIVEIAYIDDVVLGFYVFCIKSDRGELEHLWIGPDFIGKGCGKLLMGRIIEKFGYLECIEVYSDPNAQPFYEKYGFTFSKWFESTPKGRKLPVLVRSQRTD